MQILHLVEAKPGKVPETWASPEMAIDFAEWLSLEFSSFVKRIFIRYLKGDHTLAAEILARDHNRDRVERAKNRLHCSDTNKTTAQLAFAAILLMAQVYSKTHGNCRACQGDRARRDKTTCSPIYPLARNSPVGV